MLNEGLNNMSEFRVLCSPQHMKINCDQTYFNPITRNWETCDGKIEFDPLNNQDYKCPVCYDYYHFDEMMRRLQSRRDWKLKNLLEKES